MWKRDKSAEPAGRVRSELPAKLLTRAEDEHLHCGDGRAQLRRDLSMGKTAELAEQERLALAVGERRERFPDLVG